MSCLFFLIPSRNLLRVLLGLLCGAAIAQSPGEFLPLQSATNREMTLRLALPGKTPFRVEYSDGLTTWIPLFSTLSTGTNVFVDSATPRVERRFYRAVTVEGTNLITGDHLDTGAGDLVVHPINHATLVLGWAGRTIYVDPVGGASRFVGLVKPDVIIVTHGHGDHFDSPTIAAIRSETTLLYLPAVARAQLSTALRTNVNTVVLTNGAVASALGLMVEAVPAYNRTTAFHPKGTGNGYVLTLGSKRIYVSGDTEDVPEMRSLTDIDIAFVCMNLPFTMTGTQAADAVRTFRPRVVYPYHFSDSNVQQFKKLVGTDLDIEVRLRKWY